MPRSAQPMRPPRGWYGALLPGLSIFLPIGFVMSAAANRLLFAAWGLAFAVLYAGLLRHGWGAAWRGGSLAAAALAVVAGGWAVLAALVGLEQTALDLGFRAHLPHLYRPWLTRPHAAALVSGAAAAAALWLWLRSPAAHRR